MSAAGTAADYDVVIVGAGLIGAAMALLLRDSGLRLALIDSQPVQAGQPLVNDPISGSASATPEFDARVSAITPASRELFESIGVWQTMVQWRASPYTHMHVRETDGTGSIDFCAADIHASALGHIVENRICVAAMHQKLQTQPMLDCVMPARVDAVSNDQSVVQLTLDSGRQLTTRLLIAADGAQSPVRAMTGFTTREWDYEHEAIVCSVRTEQKHGQCARQIFMDDGVLAFLPLAAPDDEAGHWCSIVWSVLPLRAQALMGLPDEAFCQTLSYASEHWLGQIQQTSTRISFPLTQRHAVDYVQGRTVLVGDAAHSIHPLAGQGANLGLADVAVLARELIKGKAAGRDPADPLVLARYQRLRKPHNLSMMLMMEGFKRLYADQPLAVRWLRNTGMKAVNQWPMLKHQLIREAMGSGIKIS
ncbi:MAG: UbiH/UbiF/VisC/COQ6 family ubiquinone biosynthesis hydroxylase [Pseudohongiella sp.]|nr:UbiH/UbiF/VisC/COQ6 family ubiquinone biosynthesis hydroxylase [Pseudohongiella sp.]